MEEYKNYQIIKAQPAGMWSIKWPMKGGSVPEVLRGLYTRVSEAKQAIDTYLSTKVETKKDDKQAVSS